MSLYCLWMAAKLDLRPDYSKQQAPRQSIYPRKQTRAMQKQMSALGDADTHAKRTGNTAKKR